MAKEGLGPLSWGLSKGGMQFLLGLVVIPDIGKDSPSLGSPWPGVTLGQSWCVSHTAGTGKELGTSKRVLCWPKVQQEKPLGSGNAV